MGCPPKGGGRAVGVSCGDGKGEAPGLVLMLWVPTAVCVRATRLTVKTEWCSCCGAPTAVCVRATRLTVKTERT
jgi:hypothetical protein